MLPVRLIRGQTAQATATTEENASTIYPTIPNRRLGCLRADSRATATQHTLRGCLRHSGPFTSACHTPLGYHFRVQPQQGYLNCQERAAMSSSSVRKHAGAGSASDQPTVPEPSFAERARTLVYLGRLDSLSTRGRLRPPRRCSRTPRILCPDLWDVDFAWGWK